MTLRAVSYGGGVQSTALLVLAAQRRIDFPLFIMANVGDDSENPDTLAYVRDHAAPYAERHGIKLAVVDRIGQRGPLKGQRRTLFADLTRDGVRGVNIPVYVKTKDGWAPGNRNCTATYKMQVIGRELRARGATEDDPAVVGIGISSNEVQRINTRRSEPWERVVYPLVSVGEDTGLHLSRLDCERIIADAGLPVPPKSSCWFCPFKTPGQWADDRRRHPDRFEAAAELEQHLLETRATIGRDPAYLTGLGGPLRDVISDDVPLFDVDSGCDSGWCMT